jgi:hypothetical protein
MFLSWMWMAQYWDILARLTRLFLALMSRPRKRVLPLFLVGGMLAAICAPRELPLPFP